MVGLCYGGSFIIYSQLEFLPRSDQWMIARDDIEVMKIRLAGFCDMLSAHTCAHRTTNGRHISLMLSSPINPNARWLRDFKLTHLHLFHSVHSSDRRFVGKFSPPISINFSKRNINLFMVIWVLLYSFRI